MARKSAKAAATAPVVDIGALPEPPEDLTDDQAALWHQVVATKPSDWWDASNLPMLRALVVHDTQARMLDKQLERYHENPEWLQDEDGLKHYKRLSSARAEHTKCIETLSTKMRLTQQSRYGARQADTAARKPTARGKGGAGGVAKRPWQQDA